MTTSPTAAATAPEDIAEAAPTLINLTAAEWPAFWSDNREALEDDGLTEAEALDRARRGDLLIGGGAAPVFIVSVEAIAKAEARS